MPAPVLFRPTNAATSKKAVDEFMRLKAGDWWDDRDPGGPSIGPIARHLRKGEFEFEVQYIPRFGWRIRRK